MKKIILILISLISLNVYATQDSLQDPCIVTVFSHVTIDTCERQILDYGSYQPIEDTCIETIYDTVTYIEWQYEYIVIDTFTIYKIEYIYETIYDTVIVYYDSPLSIEQQTFQSERILVKTVNIKGQIVTNRPRNVVLIDVYSDGSTRKYIIR